MLIGYHTPASLRTNPDLNGKRQAREDAATGQSSSD